MAYQKAFGQQPVIHQMAHGTDANKTTFAKRAKKGQRYWATDTKKLYFAFTAAGSSPAQLLGLSPPVTGS